MARAKTEYKVRIFVSFDGGPELPWEELTPERRQEAGTRIAARMGAALTEYYRTHPEEWGNSEFGIRNSELSEIADAI